MLKIKLLLKGITKYPISLVLNLLSLLISFSGIIILVLYVSYEYSFDDFNRNMDQIYKVNIGSESYTVPAVIAPVIKDSVPDIEAISALWFTNDYITTPQLKPKKTGYYERGMYARDEIFDIFTFPLIYGKSKDALKEANTVVICRSLATKLFEKQNPTGQEILLNDHIFKVSAVMEDIPDNASFHVQYICSWASLTKKPDSFVKKWSEWSFQVFCKVNKHTNVMNLEKKINQITEIKQNISGNPYENELQTLHLDPLSRLHFSTNTNFVIVNERVLNVLIIIALILFIMGMVNFINLTTAQAFQKFKTLAVGRIFGAHKKEVFLNIIFQSVLVSVIALLLSLWFHRLLSSYIQEMLNIQGLEFGSRIEFYLYFLLMAMVFGIMGGLYSAVYINTPSLSQMLKANPHFHTKWAWIKDSLIVFQFVFAIVLIIITIGINRQIQYWHNYDIGIPKKNILYLHTTKEIRKHHQAFAEELLKDKSITEFTYSNFVPGMVGMSWGRSVDNQQISFVCWPVDENFLDFFHIKIIQGRPFSKNMEADEGSLIFNKKAVETFGWDKPLEKKIFGFQQERPVVGISKNFNFASLKENIQPMAFWLVDMRRDNLFLKLNTDNYPESIARIKKIWESYDPVHEFNYTFLDQSLDNLYKKEERISNFIRFVSLWSILLALTGLLGIVIFTTRRRTQEIGIRKVNGAQVIEIVKMLNKSFLKWVFFALFIAVPIAYYLLHQWLNEFPYRMEITWWIFALAGLIVSVLTVLVISWNSFMVARKNPVESLKYE